MLEDLAALGIVIKYHLAGRAERKQAVAAAVDQIFEGGLHEFLIDFLARNAAIAYLMKAYGNFENEVDKVLQSYFNACAIRMSCVDLARAFIYLANRGVPLGAGEPLLPARTTKQVNALLATCGLYDEAGDFAYRVGMPGKSGVGGGIMALIPGELCVCVWSPELNKAGNSLAGTAALELLAERLGRSIF